ncbi:MAG TPA: gliding motility-associated C-terminal domain-containing protein [Bacteroidia bacterium]|jgi:gliding motility-associated-like protein|nr:gliding motility-associated C-terminal domain-containing protein [Bacteroidia bacterium]
MKKLYFFVVILLACTFLNAANPNIIFKENKGQWPEKVLFGTEIYNTKFYVNKNSFNYCIYNPEEYIKGFGRHKPDEKPSVIHGHNYEVTFVGADLTKFIKKEEQTDYYNYFLGKDKSKWASNVKAFGNVLFNEIYNGVDLKLYSSNVNFKYDFIVKPNANVNSIKLNFKYIDGIEIVNDELIIKTSVGNTVEETPFVYQIINGITKQVKCKYTLINKNTIGFIFPEGYNKNYELIIDPTVVVCSYSGATNYAFGDCCTYDANGNIYVGADADPGYPTTPGAFQLNNNSLTTTGYWNSDIIISVYNSNGTAKLFSTYIGGDYADFPMDIIVKNNEITIFGFTNSDNYPCTANAFDTTYNSVILTNDNDIVISKLNTAGTTLLASTYIGGTKNECYSSSTLSNWGWAVGEMECDTSGNVYIIGATNSPDFPVTAGVISNTLQGTTDAYVFKINNTLSNLIWSTYLGGSLNEGGISIKLDGSGGVYCYGSTTSSNFPTTAGAYKMTKNGTGINSDLYVSHINSNATTILASTYLGTTSEDVASLMQLDNNDVYVIGNMSSPSVFVPSPGVYSNPNGHNFIYKLNSSLSSLAYKTKFGFPPPNVLPAPTPYLSFSALKIDSCGKIYLAGFGPNLFPTTPNALQPYGGGPTDLYIAQFNPNCASLAFASFFGGPNTTTWPNTPTHNPGEMSGLTDFDNKGYYYASIGINGGLPTTPGAYAMTWVNTSTWSPCNDAFVKIDMQSHINATSSYGGTITGCPPFNTHFVSTTNTGTSFWNLGDGTTTNQDTISHTYNNLGTYNVLLVVTDTNTCQRTDSIKSILNVINPTSFDLGDDVPACLTTPTILQANVTAVTYSWSTGQTTPTISATPGTYTLTINNGGCNSSDVVNVIIAEKKLSERFPNVITPNGDQANDFIDFSKYNFDEVEFVVYDRWGRERFKITDPTEQWQPKDLDNGTYFWVVNYRSSCTGKFATDKGFVSLFK